MGKPHFFTVTQTKASFSPAYLPPLIPEGGAGHESESNMGEYEDNHRDQNYNGTEHHRITPKPKTTRALPEASRERKKNYTKSHIDNKLEPKDPKIEFLNPK